MSDPEPTCAPQGMTPERRAEIEAKCSEWAIHSAIIGRGASAAVSLLAELRRVEGLLSRNLDAWGELTEEFIGDVRYHRARCTELEREVERLRGALGAIRDMGGLDGHEDHYDECPQCDASNADDVVYHGRVLAYEQAAIVARAALSPQAGAE